ncbi:MAG: 1-(5-phosphoribosyl)-5-[(5-phosphoribosylamino)methylideneamino]imidazole-4-carboxamide isomerase [Chloroflexi bacterium]|nr:1-(5-phosphoribosyl)-5-[(5-phosphoribosylamino)methylideneamino]imidazole-4-carboxamide isomerase [Chloroflexota bacterium]
MIVYPAIDIRGGKVVRLTHGDPDQQTVYSDDPVETAVKWKNAGAKWLHVVDLDGTLGGASPILDIVRQLSSIGTAIQFAGGLRSLDLAEQALKAGATRIVLGTLVVKQPELARMAVERFGAETVVVALDARGNQVTTHGWQEVSQWTPVDLGKKFYADGVRHALYTDVSRDGDLSGVNVASTANLAIETELEVIASGGVATLQDITKLKATGRVSGVVIGRALYSGAFQLGEALKLAR